MKKIIYILIFAFSFFAFQNNVFAKHQPLTLELECKYETTFTGFNGKDLTADIKTNIYCNDRTGECWFKPTEDNPQIFRTVANGGLIELGSFYFGDHKIINGADYLSNKTKCPAYIIFQSCTKATDKGFYFANSSSYNPFGNKNNCKTIATPNTYSKSKNETNSSGGGGSDSNVTIPEDVILSFCDETVRIWRLAGYLVTALKIMVPVLIIVFGSIDLGKAMLAGAEDEIKKSTGIIVKRVIAGIIIFFIPLIVQLIFSGISGYSNAISSGATCINCLTEPGSC